MKKPNLNISPVNLPKIPLLDLLKLYSQKVRCEETEHKASQIAIELRKRLNEKQWQELLTAAEHLQLRHGNGEFDELIQKLICKFENK